MKRFLTLSLLFLVLMLFTNNLASEELKKITPQEMTKMIHWFAQAAVKIDWAGKKIYIDPYKIKEPDKADIILITHSHSDHFSVPDISKILTKETIFVAPKDCVSKIGEIGKNEVITLEPGMNETIGDILIEAVPAYNIVKTQFHPKSNKWLGYILTIQGVRIYHTGDTERVPEMKDLNCDIILLPLGQTYTMNSVKEATEVVLDVKAKIAIPIHYGLYEGTDEDAESFKKMLADKIEVILKKPE